MVPQSVQDSNDILVGTFFPQNVILRHKNVKVIVTHGGMNSVTEALLCGKPLVFLPIFGDQPYNAFHASRHKVATVIDKLTLT